VSSGVVPRNRDWGSARSPLAAMANTAASARIRNFGVMAASHPFDLHGAFLEIGLQRDRVGGVERDLVDELALVEPGYEHHAARHLVAPARLDPRADEAAARLHLDLVAAAQLQLGR